MQSRIQFSPHGLGVETRVLAGLCAFEAALLLAAIGWQKSETLRQALTAGKASAAFLAGITLAAVCLMALLRLYPRSGTAARRAFALGLVVNLLTLIFALAAAEVLLRSVAVQSGEGLRLGMVTVPPTWDETRARNMTTMNAAYAVKDRLLSYFVSDPELGWTIGPGRGTPDGIYFSSVEGIRSAKPGVAFSSSRPPVRIALIGDSYTFSMDVPFEDSWGYHLERQLGRDAQVLNFGVDGYGLDQSLLRYQRDVRAWRPDIVLFGLIQHDIQRTVAVYPFLSFGWDYPFAKPRFTIDGDGLRLLNMPLISSQDIVAHADVDSLPYVDYDIGYQEADWRWRRGDAPLVVRLFGTAFRRWPTPGPAVSGATAASLSGRILREFLDQAKKDGAAARVLYFPSEGAGDFGTLAPPGARSARAILRAVAPDHLDLTACVLAVPGPARLVPGRTHYTGLTNEQVARCVAADLAARSWLKNPADKRVAMDRRDEPNRVPQ